MNAKKDNYVPDEKGYGCVNSGFPCWECYRYNPVTNGCSIYKIKTSTYIVK